MSRKRIHTFSPASCLGRMGWWWPGSLMVVFLACSPLFAVAQDSGEAADDGQSGSQHVEESEEAYRRRMETEQAGDGADVVPDRTSGGLKVAEGIDALPYESRKHLRDEMRNVIIEQGEWQPNDAGEVYPYHPSTAAQSDPELRQEEEKAWGELVQEYHKREAAALAGGGRSSSGAGQSGSQSGSQNGSQSGDPAEAARSSSSQASRNQSSRSSDSRPEADAASSTAAGAGVSQSALEFLKGQSGNQAGGQSGAKPASGSSQSSGQAAGQADAQQTAMASASAAPNTPAAEQQKSESAAEAEPSAAAKKEQSGDPEPPPPPGSVAITELLALENAQQAKASEEAEAQAKEAQAKADAAADPPANTQDNRVIFKPASDESSPPPRPGTIAIPELEKLQGVDPRPSQPDQPPSPAVTTGQKISGR